MEEESEKRFHSIMDKLFHAPPRHRSKLTTTSTTPPDSISSLKVQLSRGKNHPNMASVFGQKSKGVIAERLQNSTVLGGSVQTPECRPWDRGDLMKRLATFKSMTWFAKPQVVSAVNCARRGWANIDVDTIACEACGSRIFFSAPSSWTQHQVEKAALVFSLKLDNGHKQLCPWIDNACDETLAQFPHTSAAVLVDEYKKRFSALLGIFSLPAISFSAIGYMRSHQLENFLMESSVAGGSGGTADTSQKELLGNEDRDFSVSYYQAHKIISLCGWEPRLLPYIVQCKDQQQVSDGHNNSSIVAYYSDMDPTVDANDDGAGTNRVHSDPNSVVLDCKFCGASVGLWTFTAVPRPLEFLRLVGCTEDVNHDGITAYGTHDLSIVNGVQNREGTLNTTAFTGATSVSEKKLNLGLTIAGGPLPAKQNFRAAISLPVIGRNLRARISFDPDFGDRICPKNPLQGIKSGSLGSTAADALDSNKEKQIEGSPNCVDGDSRKGKMLENTQNISTGNEAVPVCSISQVGDSFMATTSVDIVENGVGAMIEAGASYLEESPGTDTVRDNLVDTTQDGSGVEVRVQPVDNAVLPWSIGKNKDQQLPSAYDAMEFDPIRQHRHFCPWIDSTGSGDSPPGWQRTLSALQSHKEFSCPPIAPLSSSSIEVDDPVASVKKLFTPPSAKRIKPTPPPKEGEL